MESFSFGKPSRGGPSAVRLAGIAAVALVLVGLAVAIFQVTRTGGEQAVRHVRQDVQQVDVAGDQAAQATLAMTVTAARISSVETGSFSGVTPEALAAAEPSLSYTTGPSTGPDVVSVAARGDDLGLAVQSRSGSCFYLHASPTGQTQGVGAACTGQAALSV